MLLRLFATPSNDPHKLLAMESRPRLRRRRILSPLSRGILLFVVFLLWVAISGFYGQEDQENDAAGDKIIGARKLLQESSTPATDSEGMVILSSDDDPYDENGELKEKVCISPAIEQFPRPFLSKTARRFGGIIVHISVATYMFIGLAIACDDYFVPALDKIVEALNLDPDVAGATFMAAGSSGPELATAVIGVFVAKKNINIIEAFEEGLVKDDIGVSGVIGSAVFNITLVIAVCALAAEQVFILNWWSVVRDCTCYLISIIVLLFTIANEIVSWPEALFLLILYLLYCVAMAFNSRVEAVVKGILPVPDSWRATQTHASVATSEEVVKNVTNGTSGAMELGQVDGMTEVAMSPPNPDPRAVEVHAVEPLDNPLEKPMDGNKLALIKFYLLYPLYFVSKYTIPDCRVPQMSGFYVATFLLSIAWISVYSYVMVWMITIIGFTLAIPDTVMGLTFIAAGVSVPDALSGIAVVKEGHGDMAVSNAIGSNVFDILVCLGVPWFLETAVVDPGSYVRVRSKGLIYSTFSLFSTVVFLIVASHFNGWRLDKKYGIVLLIWYFIFMVFASLYELNIFGEFNPTECNSNY